MEQELDDIILLDENGEEVHFAHILTFLYEGERYVALEPLDADTDLEAEEAEVVLFQIRQDDTGDIYTPIENEVLQNEVFDEFLSLLDEMDETEE